MGGGDRPTIVKSSSNMHSAGHQLSRILVLSHSVLAASTPRWVLPSALRFSRRELARVKQPTSSRPQISGYQGCHPTPCHSSFPLGPSWSSWKPLPSGEPLPRTCMRSPHSLQIPQLLVLHPGHVPDFPETHTHILPYPWPRQGGEGLPSMVERGLRVRTQTGGRQLLLRGAPTLHLVAPEEQSGLWPVPS